MTSFKKGARVRLRKTTTHQMNVKDGTTAVVAHDYDPKINTYLEIKWDPDQGHKMCNGGYYAADFVLIDAEQSDEELAKRFRELRGEIYPIFTELKKRGYSIRNDNGGTINVLSGSIKIARTEYKEI